MLQEIQTAQKEILANPQMVHLWNPILSQIHPSFLQKCEMAVKFSEEFILRTLAENMLSEVAEPDRGDRLSKISALFANRDGNAHNTHIQFQQCLDCGLNVSRLEEPQTFQDLVLTVHHCYMHTLGNTTAFKIIENDTGVATVKQQVN